ncbi:MAG: carboxylesterase family protein [Desulfobulbaceae bacterium]
MGFIEKYIKTSPSPFNEEQFESIKYQLSKPDTDSNESSIEQYPLVVYLHGAGERGTDNSKQIKGLAFLGNGSSAQAREFRKEYPCFVYVPQCPLHASWEGAVLSNVINTIEHLKSTRPIDPKRLYLIGYSMGGSGVYELAAAYHDFNGQLFAGIIRLAGQSSFDNRVHEIIAKTAIWIHIGMLDTLLRVEKAREAYTRLKKIHNNPPENKQILNIDGMLGETSTLTIDKQEKVKLTEYPAIGHGINLLPFDNPALLEWLFDQIIK